MRNSGLLFSASQCLLYIRGFFGFVNHKINAAAYRVVGLGNKIVSENRPGECSNSAVIRWGEIPQLCGAMSLANGLK